ncbi:hypothetical protein BJV82DRAFT_256815 [Fennellomyces sp. T-0311]|nr:hypothetical protein BJV82DRAFT_256815 [Fennellomyces sp. T-0311]
MVQLIDRAIDKAGPIFIVIAVLLIDMCTLAYYLVVFPYSHNLSEASFWGKVFIILIFIFTIYMVYCIHFHYYMAIKTHPGSMSEICAQDLNQPEASGSTMPEVLLYHVSRGLLFEN